MIRGNRRGACRTSKALIFIAAVAVMVAVSLVLLA
jgi:hypothetical protein